MKQYWIAIILLLSMAAAASASPKPTPKLTKDEAQAIALKQVSGTVKSGELEKEHGRWIYSFDIQAGKKVHEVNVDANTGAVVENTVASAAAEAKEKKADEAAKHK